MHQFVVKLTAVTSSNRTLQGLEPFSQTAYFHDSAAVPCDDYSDCFELFFSLGFV